jgi:hypothetical protein
MKNKENIEDYELYYVTENFKEGKIHSDELTPGGDSIKVTKNNIKDYINKR